MRSAIIIALAFVSACQHIPAAHLTDCTSGKIRLLTDFPQARAEDCQRTGPDAFEVTIRPETTPINPSPWYAFDLETDGPGEVKVTLRYEETRHRYHPKRQDKDGTWRRLFDGNVHLEDDGSTAVLKLTVQAGSTRIAGQEVFGPQERNEWVRDLGRRASAETFILGQSVEGRDLVGIRWLNKDEPQPLVIVVGGQHPPEVPGVLGLRVFLDRLVLYHPTIRQSHAFLMIPELNPDGVARGHWRTNAGLIDLNRDWGPFTQPETRIVRDEIVRLTELGFDPVLLLDFHATRRNVFYTPEMDPILDYPELTNDWLSAIDLKWDGEMPKGVSGHNPDNPTTKTWFVETFASTAITVEYGDEVGREEIQALAEASADALAEVLERVGNEE